MLDVRPMVLGSGGVCTAAGVPASNPRQLGRGGHLGGWRAAVLPVDGEWDRTLEAVFAELAEVPDSLLAAGDDFVTRAALLDRQHKLRFEAKHTRTIRIPWTSRKGQPEGGYVMSATDGPMVGGDTSEPGKRNYQLWLLIGGVGVAVAGLIAAVLWFVWLSNDRPGLGEGETYGIDVSHHQDEIDWNRVAADDIAFAYIKATEGGNFVDSRFEENWEGAASAGLARGVYHFFTLCTPGDVQAENFLGVVPADPDALAPAIDLELAGNCAARPSQEWLERELGTFLDTVEATTGKDAVLYIGDDFEQRYRVRDSLSRPLWLRFHRRPNVEGWLIWQVRGFADVDGIEGRVDLDIMRRSTD